MKKWILKSATCWKKKYQVKLCGAYFLFSFFILYIARCVYKIFSFFCVVIKSTTSFCVFDSDILSQHIFGLLCISVVFLLLFLEWWTILIRIICIVLVFFVCASVCMYIHRHFLPPVHIRCMRSNNNCFRIGYANYKQQ